MIVLLPVSRFRVTYEVAAGRPFSQLERMVLAAAHEGTCDLVALEQTFQVHRRILIEALVTLTQAGWLSVSGPTGGGFMLTSEGRDAVTSDRPPATTAVSTKRMFVLMERLSGGLVPNEEVRFSTRRDLEQVWDGSLILRADVLDNRIDEGQVQHLLRRAQGEWVRWIGPIDMVSKNAHWVAVNVDPQNGTVVGLPDAWRSRLGGLLIEEARRNAHKLSEYAKSLSWAPRRWGSGRPPSTEQDEERGLPPGTWPVRLSVDDLAFTAGEHGTAISAALREAQSSVFVASAFLGRASLEALRADLLHALGRGLDVDLLWGYSADDGAMSGVDWLRKVAYDARQAGLSGRLRFNRNASGSHAKLLIHDSSDGYHARVGSFNWLSGLSTSIEPGVTNVSVRFSDPGLVGALARCAAGLWSASDPEALSSTADRWRRAASELEKSARTSQPKRDGGDSDATARIVLDREHESLLREWASTAQQRLLVCSHRLGAAAEVRLVPASNLPVPTRTLRVQYDQSDLDEGGLARVLACTTRAGGALARVAGLHAKVLVCDASACVTSYNFLSADPFGRATRAREVGVVIESPLIASHLWETLSRAE